MTGAWRRLGKLLIADRVVNQRELDRALKAQALYGGRLGTNLVDLELLSIEEVAMYLSVQLGVAPVAPTDLSVAVPEVVNLLTPEQCLQHKVVPLACDGKLLKLAMLDPRDQVAVTEIGLMTKTRVVPFVAPELLLLQALEKRYGIRRDKRFLRAPQDADLPEAGLDLDLGSNLPPTPRRQPAITALEEIELPPQLAAEPTAEPAERDEDYIDYDETDQYVDSDVTNPWARPTADVLDLASALASLNRVRDRAALVNHLVRCFHAGSTCVLFMVRGPLAVAQVASETSVSHEEVESLILPVNTPSLLEQALSTKMAVRAVARNDPLQQVISRHLGWPDPGEACVAPVLHDGRVINLLCVQTSSGEVFADGFSSELGRLCDQAGKSYDRLVRSHTHPSEEELTPYEEDLDEQSTMPGVKVERPTLYDTRFFVTGLAFTRYTVAIWRAVDTSTQKIVALHVAQPGALRTEEIQRLTQEALTLQTLSHPGLPRHLGAGISEQGHAYVVTEWLDGVSLHTVLVADPVPPRADVASVLSGVCGTLEATHRHKICHRDVNPETIMLVGPNHRHVKLAAFGFVRDPPLGSPEEDQFYGSPRYRAPEVTAGRPAGPAADVYAVGVLAFEMLVGRPPTSTSELELARVPDAVRGPISWALSPKPEDRPEVGTLGDMLSRALRGHGGTPPARKLD
jgi:hypothetical protein